MRRVLRRNLRGKASIGMTEYRTPIRTSRARPAGRLPVRFGVRLFASVTALAVAFVGSGPSAVTPAHAQGAATRGMPVIRDTEIEQLLRDYAEPILKVAGLGKQNVKVVVLSL